MKQKKKKRRGLGGDFRKEKGVKVSENRRRKSDPELGGYLREEPGVKVH